MARRGRRGEGTVYFSKADRLLAVAMGLDLGTYLAVPASVRAAAESNPLAGAPLVAFAVKIGATLVILALISRLRHHQSVAVLIVVAITLAGVASNLRGL